MTTDAIIQQITNWINNRILQNPSGQDQIGDHLLRHAFFTFLLLTFPYGIYLGLLPVGYAFWKEFKTDGHWKDFFSGSESGQDGRCDLFFRLLGSGIGYLTLVWR